MITRKEYMADSRNLHHAYYLEIAREAGISYANSSQLPRIKAALAAGDEHLNTIPLHWWDVEAYNTSRAVTRALKARGTFWSLGDGVCAHKAAAIEDARAV